MEVEEILDILSEHEDRLGILESRPGTYSEPPIEKMPEEPEWTAKQRDMINQLKSEVTGWRKKHAETLLALDKLTAKIKLYEGGDLT